MKLQARSMQVVVSAAVSLLLAFPPDVHAQRGLAPAPQMAQAAAPIDITGYWVSLVTEDWRVRMVTPQRGNYESVPLNPEGRLVADNWDPAIDEAAGEACKSYGAAAIMRVPGRLHITWEDENALRIDTDAGMQTRLFHFGDASPASGERTWQGYSQAEWELARTLDRNSRVVGGNMKVVTSNLRAGYLRKNGVPYSEEVFLREHYDHITAPNGDPWLIVTTEVVDPQYLTGTFITSTHFRKQVDDSGWNPTPCSAH